MKKEYKKKEIIEKYDLDKERRDIEVLLHKGELNLSFDEPLTKEEFIDHITSSLNHYPDNVLLQYSVGDWDNADEIQVVEKTMLPEDDRDVINRLLKTEREERSKSLTIDKAKKLLADNNYDIKERK